MSRRNHRDGKVWPKRRQWLDRIAGEVRLTHGCKAWLLQLARRSDDGGKPVWGNQAKMAAELGRCDRSVRRYRAEAEQLGYLLVFRSKPQRGPDGRWSRRKANSYYLCLPAKATASQSAPRRRQRAPYCVLRKHTALTAPRPAHGDAAAALLAEAASSADQAPVGLVAHLADSDDRSTPLKGVRQPSPHPTVGNPNDLPDQNTNGIAAARAALAACTTPSRTSQLLSQHI